MAFGQVGGKKWRHGLWARWEVVVCFVDTGRSVDHHCLNFPFKKKIFIKRILHVTKEKIGPNLELFQPVTKQFFDI